jgi:hypothetical protein
MGNDTIKPFSFQVNEGRFTLESGQNNSILNPLLDLRRYIIEVHLGPKRQVWFQKLYGGTKQIWRIGAKSF